MPFHERQRIHRSTAAGEQVNRACIKRLDQPMLMLVMCARRGKVFTPAWLAASHQSRTKDEVTIVGCAISHPGSIVSGGREAISVQGCSAARSS
jgi:hypothetical protein